MLSTRRQFLSASAIGIAGTVGLSSLSTQRESDTTSSYDWPMARYDPSGTGYNPDASGPKHDVAVAWQHEAPDWFRGSFQPIRHGETIFIGGNGLLALDKNTGQRQFSVPGPYHSPPTIASTSIYQTDTLGITGPAGIYGLNASGGQALPFTDHRLGGERWSGPHSSTPGFFEPTEAATPITASGLIYSALPGTNDLVAVNPNSGDIQWRQSSPKDEASSNMYNRPAVYNGIAFVTAWPYQVTAYSAKTGDQHWHREISDQMVLPPVATDEGVVIQTRESIQLRARSDGALLWERTLDGNATDSSPAVADGTIFVADEQESLHALSLSTGQTQWTAPFDGRTTPVVAEDRVYCVDSLWALKAFDRNTGEQQFKYHPSEVPLSPPIVGDGILYLANRSQVLALEEA